MIIVMCLVGWSRWDAQPLAVVKAASCPGVQHHSDFWGLFVIPGSSPGQWRVGNVTTTRGLLVDLAQPLAAQGETKSQHR